MQTIDLKVTVESENSKKTTQKEKKKKKDDIGNDNYFLDKMPKSKSMK